MLWVLTGLFLGGVACTGCASKNTYRYETIHQDYAGYACHLSKTSADQAAAASACRIDRRLTLAEVLDIAQTNNPDLLMAAARIERARATLAKSAAPFYPQVTLTTEYTQGDAPSAYLFKAIDQRKLPQATVDFNHPGWFENYESGASLGINLFNGGRDTLNREIAKTGVTLSELDRNGIKNQVMATAIGTYYNILAAAKYTRVAQEALNTTQSQLDIMDVRYRSGAALKTDLLSLQVRMAESEELLLQSRNRHRLAQAALAELLGVEPDMPFAIAEDPAYAVQIPQDPASAEGYALLHRPELASAREKLRQSRMALDAARAGYLPRLDFMTRYYVDDPAMKYSTERDNWTAGLYLSWKIFDGFATHNERKEALAQLQEAMAGDRKALLAVKFDVKRSYFNLDEAEKRLKVATSNVKTADETFRLVKRQYEGGAANITRYLEAELAYNQARIRETTAYFDREKARAQIARAIGHWTGPAGTRRAETN
ncbi:TolC family protein [Desulfosarcina cetonica]